MCMLAVYFDAWQTPHLSPGRTELKHVTYLNISHVFSNTSQLDVNQSFTHFVDSIEKCRMTPDRSVLTDNQQWYQASPDAVLSI